MRANVVMSVLLVATAGALLVAAPAGAGGMGAGGSGSSRSSAGGSHASGSSSSSASVSSSGGSSVGVVQGTVSEGGSASGSSGSAAASGSGSQGGLGGAADEPSAVNDGVLSQLELPAMRPARDATPASAGGSDAYAWLIGAGLAAGLVLLYRRLPRPTRA